MNSNELLNICYQLAKKNNIPVELYDHYLVPVESYYIMFLGMFITGIITGYLIFNEKKKTKR